MCLAFAISRLTNLGDHHYESAHSLLGDSPPLSQNCSKARAEITLVFSDGCRGDYDMLKSYAYNFAFLCSHLEYLEARLRHSKETTLSSDNDLVNTGRQLLSYTKSNCELLRSQALIAEIDRIERQLNYENVLTERYKHSIEHLGNHIRDALEAESFLHVPSDASQLYEKKELFGPIVSSKFPESIQDVACAGSCLALGQPTACVFHLMRVMEDGVQALGKKLRLKIQVKVETWYQILEHVDKAIESMPNKTPAQRKKKENHANISVLLSHVRIAWRNDVMHPKRTYTLDEAREVFDAVKSFMRHLANFV